MIFKKGAGLVLRNILFMLLIFSIIGIFASVFVDEMATTYSNTDMESEYEANSFNVDVSEAFYDTSDTSEDVKEATEGGIGSLVLGGLTTAGNVLKAVFLAPVTFGNMISTSLEEMNVSPAITDPVGIFIMALLYVLIGFAIISAFLQGGKL